MNIDSIFTDMTETLAGVRCSLDELIGKRVLLDQDVDNFPDAYVHAGATGVVVHIDHASGASAPVIHIRLDEHVEDLDEWENVLHVHTWGDPWKFLHVIPTKGGANV
jgi:hypothetical protein